MSPDLPPISIAKVLACRNILVCQACPYAGGACDIGDRPAYDLTDRLPLGSSADNRDCGSGGEHRAADGPSDRRAEHRGRAGQNDNDAADLLPRQYQRQQALHD